MTDSDPDIRWMTYTEAARVLGVNPESVAKRMRRGNWARRLGNDGKPRVGVPVSVLPSVPAITVSVPVGVPASVPVNVPLGVPDNAVNPTPSVPDIISIQSPKPDTVDPVQVLAARLDAEAERANRLEAELLEATSRAAAAEGEAAALRDAVGHARAQAVTERAARDRAQKELSAQEAREAVLQAQLDTVRKEASQAAEVDAAVRRELERFRTQQETIQKLGLLGRLAWAIRGGRNGSE